MKVIMYSNGNSGVYDTKGNQIPKLQKSWLMLYVKFLHDNGIETEGMQIIMPSGIVATIHGDSWSIR